MYLVGIDISKFKHDCFIQSETGEVIKNSFSFNNSKDGFDYLLNVLNVLDHSQEIRIGLEATGHYGDNLMPFLNEHGYSFMQFNPYLIKKVSNAFTLRRTKTDKLDAMMISKVLLSVDYKPYQLSSYHISSLKSLTRLREALIKERSLHLVKLTNVMDKLFPEFKPFFNGKFGTTAIYILKKYKTPKRISKLTDEEILQLKKLHRKSSAAKLLAYAGLEPSTIQSGTMFQNGKMVKHGSSHLRYVLMNVAMTIIMHNPTFYEYYSKKHHKEGKNHRVALSHVVRKLLRIIYHLEILDKKFDSKLLI